MVREGGEGRWTEGEKGRVKEREGSVPPIFNRVIANLFIVLISTPFSFMLYSIMITLSHTTMAVVTTCDVLLL